MKKYFLFIFILLAPAGFALAQVNFPVQELGGCASQQECKVYCDNKDHSQACLDFAKKNNLMTEQEIQVAEKFTSGKINGPGGCKSKETCEEYCDNMSHMDECLSFAEKNNLIPASELAEAKKVQAAIKNGIKPPACSNKKACDSYCEDSAHMEECINFASQAGFMSDQEKTDSQKMLQALKNGVKPLPCKGKENCDAYCNDSSHMEECMNFAIQAGFMSDQEKGDAEKALQAIKKGVNPPPCKGKEACDVYCADHADECINFALAAGMMSEEDAEMARKTGGKGPGGCKSKEECQAFCDKPENQETCFNFANENDMLPKEDVQKMQQNSQQIQQTLQNASPEVMDCLVSAIGSDAVEKLKQGQPFGSKEQGQKMQPCFEMMKSRPKEGMKEQTGPGGCKSPEECQAYCETHREECQQFNAPKVDDGHKPDEHAGEPTQGPGPGGCQSEAECEAYCSTHREECGAPPPMAPDANPNQNPNWQEGQPEHFEQPPQNFQPPADQQPQQPSPLSRYINTDSLVGSLLDMAFTSVFHK